jgi:signal transduction histidine kinase
MRLGSRSVRGRTQPAHGARAAPSPDGGNLPVPSDSIRELCHDLRQPVATISALVAAAETEADIPPGVRHRLEQIVEESKRMSEMIRHVLEDTLAFEPMDPGKAVREVVDWTRITYKGRLDFVLEIDDDLLVVADRVLMRRGVSNLLENAVRAAGPGGSVAVAVGRREGWIQVDVSDSGEGEGPPQGTGLGLRIVERLTRTHGGDLAFLKAPLGGVRVRLRLPATKRVSGSRVDKVKA